MENVDSDPQVAAVLGQYRTYMSCTELFKFDVTSERFEQEIAKLPTDWVVRTCGFLEYLRDDADRLRIDVQALAINAFAPAPLGRDLLTHHQRSGDLFLYEEQLLGLIKFAALGGTAIVPPLMSEEQRKAFFWALMMYGDLHSAEFGEITEPDAAARMELRALAFAAQEVPGNVMARAYALWLDIPTRAELAASPYFIDLPAEFAHATRGHSVAEYLTVASATLTHAGDAIRDSIAESLQRWPFDASARFASSRKRAELTAAMRAFAADRAELTELFGEMPEQPRYLGVAMLPFVHRPLYLAADGKFLIISMRLLLDGLYNLAYWRVWEHLKRDHPPGGDALSARFSQFYGQVLERYVVELLQSVYDAGAKRVFPENEAQPPAGAADAAIFLDDRVILVEVTKTDLRYFETLLKGDLANFDQDLARTADKAKQVVTASDSFRAGRVTYAGHEAARNLPIEVIVVVPEPLPRFPFVNERVRGALANNDVDPDTTIVSVSELEEALMAGDLTHLFETVAAWKADAELSEMSLHNFIRIRRRIVPMERRAPYIQANAEKIRARVIQEMDFQPTSANE